MEEVLTKISWKIINEYIEKRLLIIQKHPTKNLWILNYSRSCAYDNAWDLITLSCRGMIVNENGDIISRCMKKFHNWEQLINTNYSIPNEPFEITEKMDGQLGLLFFYDNEWIFASRGSFTSIYAEKGKQLLEKYDYKKLTHDNTYIFEIIFKEGRIVCKYDYEDLILIGCINIPFGFEINIHDEWFKNRAGFKVVKKYDGINDFKVLKQMVANNAEGYVVRFRSGLRVKIKGEEYCRLHAIVTKLSNRDIWRHLKDGIPIENLLQNVPDEFDNWAKEQINMFQDTFRIINVNCQMKYDNEIKPLENTSRKEVAMKILTFDKSLHPIFFHMYDRKEYSHLIWDKIYPPYSKPFNNNDEEGDN
jgi:RNA ligase